MSFQGSSNRLAVTLRRMRQVMPCSLPTRRAARTRSIWLSSRRPLQGNHPTSHLRRRHLCRWPPKLHSWERLAETEFFMGQLDEAAEDIKKALELNPDVWPGDSMLSQIYVLQGRPQDALPESKLVRYDHQRAYLYAIAYYALGRKKESDDALRELIHKFPQNTYEIAGVYAFRNQSDEAFEWLDRAYVQRNAGL